MSGSGRRDRRVGDPRRSRHEGILGGSEATNHALRPGPNPWEKVLYSGDLFRTDDEGYLYFVGRKDDIIKTRGEKVSPKEVENTLYALPGVNEAAVIGVPDPILGMAIKAVIVPTEPARRRTRRFGPLRPAPGGLHGPQGCRVRVGASQDRFGQDPAQPGPGRGVEDTDRVRTIASRLGGSATNWQNIRFIDERPPSAAQDTL